MLAVIVSSDSLFIGVRSACWLPKHLAVPDCSAYYGGQIDGLFPIVPDPDSKMELSG
jgi:hypothetical protein